MLIEFVELGFSSWNSPMFLTKAALELWSSAKGAFAQRMTGLLHSVPRATDDLMDGDHTCI